MLGKFHISLNRKEKGVYYNKYLEKVTNYMSLKYKEKKTLCVEAEGKDKSDISFRNRRMARMEEGGTV